MGVEKIRVSSERVLTGGFNEMRGCQALDPTGKKCWELSLKIVVIPQFVG